VRASTESQGLRSTSVRRERVRQGSIASYAPARAAS